MTAICIIFTAELYLCYMKRFFLFVSLLSLGVSQAFAQDDLFGKTKQAARNGVLFNVNGAYDMPGADMAKRFGNSFRIGPAILYKTKTNWMFGAKMDFIFGNKITQDSFLINITDKYGSFLNQDGVRTGVKTYERGYLVGIQGGRIFNTSKKNADNGILVLTSVGFMQHKINIFDKNKTIPQLRNAYKKGYDRLSNGIFIEQYIGYTYFANNALVNFNIGLDIAAGFTKGRRDYLYDVMRPDNKQRVDILFGIRAGWYIPVFKRKSEELFFE